MRWRWKEPLSEDDVQNIYSRNESTCELVTYPDWHFGPLVKATLNRHGRGIYYCGGDKDFWKNEKEFFDAYPEGIGNPHILPEPEFDLEEISKAQEIIEGLS